MYKKMFTHLLIIQRSAEPQCALALLLLGTAEPILYVLTCCVFLLTYRYGNEDKLVTLMGVMQALISFVQDGKNALR